MTIEQWFFGVGRAALSLLPEKVANNIRGIKRTVLNKRPPDRVFRKIFHNNTWDGTESISGPGSTLAATASVRANMPSFLEQINARSILDIPCGDAFWIGHCLPPGLQYTGADIVPEIVAHNVKTHAALGNFMVLNIVTDSLPKADVALVRDCFIHLPHSMILAAIKNLRNAGINYILTTTYPDKDNDIDIEIGGFRPVNLQRPPFDFPPPLAICEDMADATNSSNKHLALWRL